MQPADVRTPFLLIGAFDRLTDRLHERLAEQGFPGMTVTVGFGMQAVGSGCTAVELGRRLGVSKQAAGRTAQQLEGLGLVERRRSPDDARELILHPTARGVAMLAASARIITDLVAQWRADSGDADVDAALRALARLAKAASE